MALKKGFGNPSCGFGWRGLRGRAGLRSHPLTRDAAAPTPSFLRASHIAATALLPELGRALGRPPSQVKVLEDAIYPALQRSRWRRDSPAAKMPATPLRALLHFSHQKTGGHFPSPISDACLQQAHACAEDCMQQPQLLHY